MAGKRRRRSEKRSDPYGSDSSDSDYEPWEDNQQQQRQEEEKPKVRKIQTHSPARSRKAPSLVTPEQIVANAAAAKHSSGTQNDQQQQHYKRHWEQDERSSDSHKRTTTHSAVALVAACATTASVKTELKPAAQVKSELKRDVKLKTEGAAVGSVQTLARNDRETAVDLESSDEQDASDTGASDDEGNGDEGAAVPAVFQCGTCRSIFGDTHALVGGNAELALLSLSAVTNIAASTTPQTSRTGVDAGSSYHELLCSECQSVLGRQYVTTPVALDDLRGLFSFETAVIATYQFGYAQLQRRIAAGDNADDSAIANSSSSKQQSAGAHAMKRATRACEAAAKALTRDRQELLQLRADMTNVQKLLLVVNERLQQLEEPEEEGQDDEMEDDDEALIVDSQAI